MSHLYEEIADLLEYPEEGWGERLADCKRALAERSADEFVRFCNAVEGTPLASLQERYTQTFDLNPVCALEIGYHLFGENYKRGLFLANLHETESPFELGQQHQLPDYLPVLLRLLVRLADDELRIALIGECLVPALDKMIEALSQAENPYRHLLKVTRDYLSLELPEDYRAAVVAGADSIPEFYQIGSRADARARGEQVRSEQL
ncbi:MAG: nitrate reductase [Blastocatellia bacterium]|nr:nitrate reductase [Blastocatellia bacterium]